MLRRLRRPLMFQISKNTPVYYFTAVTHHRLEIFKNEKLKQILCDAYDEARRNHGILILAYVVMLDHVHALVASDIEMTDVLRLLNGISMTDEPLLTDHLEIKWRKAA
jgi:REP element-mobilizing transposase RayT